MAPTVEPVRVFAIAGETNVLGWGDINQLITLSFDRDVGEKYQVFISDAFAPIVRDDAFVTFQNAYGNFLSSEVGGLSTQYGVDGANFGPELGFGFKLADLFDEDIIIVKGGGVSSLSDAWIPPSSAEGTGGEFYQNLIRDINDAVSNVDQITGLSGPPATLAGVIWFHGFSDAFNDASRNVYEENLQNLISDLRSDLDEPDLPFVIVEMGSGGENAREEELEMRAIQQRVVNANNFTSYCETAKFITFDTQNPSQLREGANRYYGRADVFVSIGEEMADQWQVAQTAQANITDTGINVRSVDVDTIFIDNNADNTEGIIVR